MQDHPVEPPRIYATFRYRDAPNVIDWLRRAFGFSLRAKHMDGDKVAHAELAFGSSIIMLGSVRDDRYGGLVGAPGKDSAGKSTYIAVADVDAVFASATAAGATILEGVTQRSYGGREFICADPEGHVWSFGTYWPKVNELAMM